MNSFVAHATVSPWLLLIGSAILSSVLTYGVRAWSQKKKIGLQVPRERDTHRQPISRLGGLAISLTFLICVVKLIWFTPQALHFVDQTIGGLDRNLFGILAGVVLLTIVGLIDDVRGLSPWPKLGAHVVAGVILAWSTVLVSHVSNPFGAPFDLGWLTYPFVVAWVVVMINVVNFLDGLDGLATGVSLIATLVLFFLAIKPEVNQLSMSVLSLLLSGSLLGFLPFNFSPAKLFLGDTGSQVIGFLLAVFAIISGGKLATAFLVLGVPILDVLWVIGRRVAARQPVYKADRFHLHHRLLQAGLNQRQAVLVFYTISAAFGIIALQTQSYGKFIAALVLIAIMVIGGAGLVAYTALRQPKA